LETIILTEDAFLDAKQRVVNSQLSITMGVFDGLHAGHKALLRQTLSVAEEQDFKSAVLSFDFSSTDLKKRDNHLLTSEETQQALAAASFDYHIIIAFGDKIKSLTPGQYVETLTNVLPIGAITVGTDFHFGRDRTGDVDFLAAYGHKLGYKVYSVPLLEANETKISSRDIETLLRAGDVEEANALLGYTYAMCGYVIHGEQKGRQLGYPTANMSLPAGKITLPNGVYVTRSLVGGSTYDSVTNIGTSPTIKSESEAIVETHIFDFAEDIYGEEIIIYFYKRIRDELKFKSIDALIEQMDHDSAISKQYLATHVQEHEDKEGK